MLNNNLEQIPILRKGGIHIKPENKGKFTDYCGGKVTEECIKKGKNSSNPAIRKRTTFAANARKWKHENGGILKAQEGTGNLLTPHPLSPVGIALNQAKTVAKMKGNQQHLPPGVKEIVGPDGKKVAIRTEQPLQSMEQSIAGWLYGPGEVIEAGHIANDIKNGNYGSATLASSLLFLPGASGRWITNKLQNATNWLKWQIKYRKDLGKLMDFSDYKSKPKVGAESTVYIDDDVVHKVMDQGVPEMTPEELIKFNERFVSDRNLPPHVMPIKVEGVVKGSTKGKYYPVYKQGKVEVVGDESMPIWEWEKHKKLLDRKMRAAGWPDLGGSYYYNKQLNKHVGDISPMNTGYKDGEIVIIDGDVYKQGGKL